MPRPKSSSATPRSLEVGPFLFYRGGDDLWRSGQLDKILVEVVVEDDKVWLRLPQFETRLCLEAPEADVEEEIAKRLLAFYVSLGDLPKQFINEVERDQIALIETLFLPWLARELGRYPRYLTLPPPDKPVPLTELQVATAG